MPGPAHCSSCCQRNNASSSASSQPHVGASSYSSGWHRNASARWFTTYSCSQRTAATQRVDPRPHCLHSTIAYASSATREPCTVTHTIAVAIRAITVTVTDSPSTVTSRAITDRGCCWDRAITDPGCCWSYSSWPKWTLVYCSNSWDELQ